MISMVANGRWIRTRPVTRIVCMLMFGRRHCMEAVRHNMTNGLLRKVAYRSWSGFTAEPTSVDLLQRRNSTAARSHDLGVVVVSVSVST